MEVHHHPTVGKKNFKEYFLEFLMIFLAVTMGFFAENLREHFVNKDHEDQYINSFYEDLSTDEKKLPALISNIQEEQIQTADSLQLSFTVIGPQISANKIYTSLRQIIRQQGVKIFVTDRTFEQIKNSGEMRLISDKQIADSLVDYYKEVDFIQYLQETLLTYKASLKADFPTIMKSQDYNSVINSQEQIINPDKNLYLLSTDPFAINKILMQVEEIRALSHTIQRMIFNLTIKVGNIKKLIVDHYTIQN